MLEIGLFTWLSWQFLIGWGTCEPWQIVLVHHTLADKTEQDVLRTSTIRYRLTSPHLVADLSEFTLGEGEYLTNVWVQGCRHPVSRICHTGAVTYVDFKMCRSLLDGNKLHRKVESSSSEAKIVQIGAESLKIFPSQPEKGTNGLSFFALEGKIEQQIRILARKCPRSPGLSKQQCLVLTSSTETESYDKHLKTPQKRQNRPTGQQKSGIYLISLKKVTFYFISRFYPSLF